jgi:hypothetical protein
VTVHEPSVILLQAKKVNDFKKNLN